ncbi:MAG: hypothetical protein WCT40_01850 [Candidatus Magasanikbacteria bacterium]
MRRMIMIASMAMMLALPLLSAGSVLAEPSTQPISTEEMGITYGAYTGLTEGDIRVTIANIIRIAMSLLGIVAVVIILIGGFTWMTAGGNDDKIGEAKKWIFAGVMGLAIILSAYALATFVINSLVDATGGEVTPQ